MAKRPPAMSTRMFFAIRDQPFLITRSENGIRVAGKRGLRIPPVSPSARNMSRKRGTICSVSPCGELSTGTEGVQLRESQTKNITSEAVNVAASATTRGTG
jgi:hypothetical protein